MSGDVTAAIEDLRRLADRLQTFEWHAFSDAVSTVLAEVDRLRAEREALQNAMSAVQGALEAVLGAIASLDATEADE